LLADAALLQEIDKIVVFHQIAIMPAAQSNHQPAIRDSSKYRARHGPLITRRQLNA
jgi:hypothetical protein